MQISMSALLTLMVVIKAVLILLDHFGAAVIVDSHSPMMEGLVWKIMSVHLEHTTASNAVSTLLGDLDVNVTQDFNSPPIRGLVPVSLLNYI